MKPPVKMMVIYVDETDNWGTTPLYEAIVRRLRQLSVAGATAQAGIMGFGSHKTVHQKRLFGVSDDRSVTISVVDSEAKLREILPEIRGMVREGLVVLLDAEVIPGVEKDAD
jgi:PII-like signaling protein